MYISCPACKAKFLTEARLIGKFGRKVKCSKCNNVWYQKADANSLKYEEKNRLSHANENYSNLANNYYNNNFKNGVNLPAMELAPV